MAASLSHKFGQIIGDTLELALELHLQKFAKKHKLYLDKKGYRAARPGKKVSWVDLNGNKHDLDFVLERGGDKHNLGIPIAFIETAWRRYTKHSRNKAQEIQGAILPLKQKYKNFSPFIGVVLAGEFTDGALKQLQSTGFEVLHIPYANITKSFSKYGIDASFDEQTTEATFGSKIEMWEKSTDKTEIAKYLLKTNSREVSTFFNALAASVARYIERVVVLPLHGQETISNNAFNAINFLKEYAEKEARLSVIRYEITIRYNTGEKIEASFRDKDTCIQFLENYI